MRETFGRRDDRGITLVELIVVMAIITVLAGASIFLYGLIPNGRVNSVARKTEAGLEKTRNNALSFYSSDYVFSMKDGTYYGLNRVNREMDDTAAMSDQGSAENLGKGVTVTVYLVSASGSDEGSFVLQNNDSLIVSFERTTGAFKQVAGSFHDGEGNPVSIDTTSGKYLDKIEVTNGRGYKKTLECTRLTGKIEIQ